MNRLIRKFLLAATASTCLVSAEATFDSTIPVLDMQEYFHPETKQKFVSELSNALKEVGFFAVMNSGVDADVLDQGYQACFDFFALPQEVKMRSTNPAAHCQRGYVP